MSRIAVPAREAAPAAAQPLLDAVEKQLGVVPNLYRLIALGPAVLQGALGLSGAPAKSASNPTAKAAVAFAAAVTRARPADLAAVRAAGFTDAQIVEIVAVVAKNVLTNFLNNVAATEIDFRVVRAAKLA
jgi:hypothetical protein